MAISQSTTCTDTFLSNHLQPNYQHRKIPSQELSQLLLSNREVSETSAADSSIASRDDNTNSLVFNFPYPVSLASLCLGKGWGSKKFSKIQLHVR